MIVQDDHDGFDDFQKLIGQCTIRRDRAIAKIVIRGEDNDMNDVFDILVTRECSVY